MWRGLLLKFLLFDWSQDFFYYFLKILFVKSDKWVRIMLCYSRVVNFGSTREKWEMGFLWLPWWCCWWCFHKGRLSRRQIGDYFSNFKIHPRKDEKENKLVMMVIMMVMVLVMMMNGWNICEPGNRWSGEIQDKTWIWTDEWTWWDQQIYK